MEAAQTAKTDELNLPTDEHVVDEKPTGAPYSAVVGNCIFEAAKSLPGAAREQVISLLDQNITAHEHARNSLAKVGLLPHKE